MSQLRGHWEDTSGKVQARKNTLEELAAANRHFEIKQQEIEGSIDSVPKRTNDTNKFSITYLVYIHFGPFISLSFFCQYSAQRCFLPVSFSMNLLL